MAGGWKGSLAGVLAENNPYKDDGTVASHATQDKRADILFQGFSDLREAGFKMDDVHSFRGKHMETLVKQWEKQELSPSTIQNRISTFRTFADWIGKSGMIEGTAKYTDQAHRSTVATEDKGWRAAGVDVQAKIDQVRQVDERVALQLELQAQFGLRREEAVAFKPHLGDQETHIAVNWGTKGGRDRTVPISSPTQRETLERAKEMAASKTASTADPKLNLRQALDRYSNVVRSCGISKADGITGHGLRHDYASTRYEQVSGEASPVRGGDLGRNDRESDYHARQVVSEELGHSREDVTTHYLGR